MAITRENYAAFFHEHGLKSTRQRNLVLAVLMNHDGIMTVEEIYQALAGADKGADLSTIYRILELFLHKDIVEKSNFPGSAKCVFSLKQPVHTHHLICLGCHKTIAIRHCPLSAFEQAVEKSTGFTIVDHQLELYGYCDTCKEKMKQDKASHTKGK